jgi:hypothetical protein
MMADRSTKCALTVIAVALTLIAAHSWIPARWLVAVSPDAALAQSALAKYEVVVPKAWGKLVSYSNNNLLLEAEDHSLRIVDVEGKAPEYPKVKVLIRFQ